MCGLRAVAQQLGIAQLRVVLIAQRQFACEELVQRVQQLDLVAQRQLDVDALHAVAIVAHARQRDHHVLVDLEGVGVFGDGGGARAVQPEFLARLGGHGDEAFAVAQVGEAHDLRGGFARRAFVVAHHVGDQHHLRARAALGLGGIADGLQITLVEMLQTGQLGCGMGIQIILDLDDGGHGLVHLAEEFQTHGAREFVRAVQDEARRGDDAVAAFLLDAGQAGQELVGHVLAQPGLAESAAGDGQYLRLAERRLAVLVEAADAELRALRVVDLAEVVVADAPPPSTVRPA